MATPPGWPRPPGPRLRWVTPTQALPPGWPYPPRPRLHWVVSTQATPPGRPRPLRPHLLSGPAYSGPISFGPRPSRRRPPFWATPPGWVTPNQACLLVVGHAYQGHAYSGPVSFRPCPSRSCPWLAPPTRAPPTRAPPSCCFGREALLQILGVVGYGPGGWAAQAEPGFPQLGPTLGTKHTLAPHLLLSRETRRDPLPQGGANPNSFLFVNCSPFFFKYGAATYPVGT